jgi:hypothetical protein
VPAQTEEKLKALISEDKSRLLAWMTGGAAADLRPKAREFERAELARRLSEDTHEAEVTRDAIADAEAEIERLGRQLSVLEKRHAEFVHAVIIEEAEAIGAEYAGLAVQLQDRLAALFGLAEAVGVRAGLRDAHATNTAAIALPRFELRSVPGNRRGATVVPHSPTGPRIEVSAARAEAEAQPWLARIRKLMQDPRAGISVDTKREHSA